MTAPHVDPFVATGGAWLIAVAVVLGLLWRASRRPLSPDDAYYDRVDRELDGYPTDEQLAQRLTVMRGGIGEVGARADRTWPDLVDVGEMTTSDGLGAPRDGTA